MKYTAWLPAHCTVKVVLETDEDLTGQPTIEVIRRIAEEGEEKAFVCHKCSDNIQYDAGNLNESAFGEQDYEIEE